MIHTTLEPIQVTDSENLSDSNLSSDFKTMVSLGNHANIWV